MEKHLKFRRKPRARGAAAFGDIVERARHFRQQPFQHRVEQVVFGMEIVERAAFAGFGAGDDGINGQRLDAFLQDFGIAGLYQRHAAAVGQLRVFAARAHRTARFPSYSVASISIVNCFRHARAGVIWDAIPFETPVIPAKAGIHFARLWNCGADGLDSRLRGNDCALDRR